MASRVSVLTVPSGQRIAPGLPDRSVGEVAQDVRDPLAFGELQELFAHGDCIARLPLVAVTRGEARSGPLGDTSVAGVRAQQVQRHAVRPAAGRVERRNAPPGA
jgi:hypothetical protein